MGKIKEQEGKDKVLDRIKGIIGTEKCDDTKTLVDTDDKFPDDIIVKNVVILMKCIIKDDGKFYLQLSFEEALFLK